jgi:hypothetical protein
MLNKEKGREFSVSRVLFPENRVMVIHLGFQSPETSSDLPGNSDGQPLNVPLFDLAPDGVYRANPVTWISGELLPHRFTLACVCDRPSAVYSLLHFPWDHSPWVLASVMPCGARTFLPRPSAGDHLENSIPHTLITQHVRLNHK